MSLRESFPCRFVVSFCIGVTLRDSIANIACPSASQGVCSTWTLESNTANGIGMLLLYVLGMVLHALILSQFVAELSHLSSPLFCYLVNIRHHCVVICFWRTQDHAAKKDRSCKSCVNRFKVCEPTIFFHLWMYYAFYRYALVGTCKYSRRNCSFVARRILLMC